MTTKIMVPNMAVSINGGPFGECPGNKSPSILEFILGP